MNASHASEHALPLVSIGLPVYNGANYVRQAIESVLAQSYDNLELVISDNASDDGTYTICAELAQRDSRIRLHRNEKNVGAAANYNRVFAIARGKYFKWASHDDVLAPSFIERSVEMLEAHPDVVLCCPRTGKIDDRGDVTGGYEFESVWEKDSPSMRFRRLVFSLHSCVIVFGLVRTAELAGTPLIAPYVNSDRVLLAELGLRGRFAEVPELLFFRRDHPSCSIRAYDSRLRIVWFDPSKSVSFAFPEWKEVIGYAGAVGRASVSFGDRIRCWSIVGELIASKWRPLLADLKYAVYGVVGRS